MQLSKINATPSLITGCLILGNDRKRVKGCIENALPFVDQILVYDGSTDGSIDLIRDKVWKVIPQSISKPDFAFFKNACLKELPLESWAWFLHTDERIVYSLDKQELKNYIRGAAAHSFALPRFNQPLGADFPDYQANLVKVGHGTFIRPLHEQLYPAPVAQPRNILINHLLKNRRELEARDKRWMEIDPETETLHRSRPEIKERSKQEYDAADGILRP